MLNPLFIFFVNPAIVAEIIHFIIQIFAYMLICEYDHSLVKKLVSIHIFILQDNTVPSDDVPIKRFDRLTLIQGTCGGRQ